MAQTKAERKAEADKLTKLFEHYTKGTEDMDTRRTRKNGWNEVVDAYMSKLPSDWPYNAVVTDPRIRTTILEKTARLLNAKLQGRLVPREGGDEIKAKINNAILEYQWDNANVGGSMLEKMAMSDQITRLFGAAFVLVYWDVVKNCNEIKVIDPRDIFIDFAANHIKNAKWVMVREFTTVEALESRGFYNLDKIRKAMKKGDSNTSEDLNSDLRETSYESVVKTNRGLDDKTGSDTSNPTVELVTEYHKDKFIAFLPKYGVIVKEGPNPYKHGVIPVAMLRYYPLGDDIYGESEVECVIPIQRAINAFLCGTIDELNLAQRPPLKITSSGVRMETIEYGPGAKWIMNSLDNVQEFPMAGNVLNNFSGVYSTLVAAFETAMGGQSLGVSNVGPMQQDKTATEIISLEKQQTSRDQYNQLYLAEFLKDIMMMWLSNNKQYLLDDPTKQYHVLKIIGKDAVKEFQNMRLDSMMIPDDAMAQISDVIAQNPSAVNDEMLNQVLQDVSVPEYPIIENPNDEPEMYEMKPKLNPTSPEEAELYIEKDDFNGVYDYIPDVKSMSAGAGIQQQQARAKALELTLNPQTNALLQTQGEMMDIKQILIGTFQDAGYKDAEGLFKPVQPPTLPGSAVAGPGGLPAGDDGMQGFQGVPPTLPPEFSPGGLPQPEGLPVQ